MEQINMKAGIILFILLLASMPAHAEKGIVLNESGYVQYKYDTDSKPALQSGEYIIPYEDINSVMKDAKYDGVSFVNPEPSLPLPEETVIITATPSPLDPNIVVLSGAGVASAYIIARRKKV